MLFGITVMVTVMCIMQVEEVNERQTFVIGVMLCEVMKKLRNFRPLFYFKHSREINKQQYYDNRSKQYCKLSLNWL